MYIESLFSTPVWIDHLNLDNEKLTKQVYKLQSEHESANVSNVGGWQSPVDLDDTEFVREVIEHVPMREDKPFKSEDFSIHNWININKKGNYNNRHTHLDSRIFLCGVYYIKAPKNCGRIRLWDPRGVLHNSMTDNRYFNDGHEYNYINVEEGMIIYFPSWLEHDVEPSKSNEDRISVAFNLFVNKMRGAT